MGREDPERRISDLERQLAESSITADADAKRERLTPDHVRNVAFARPPFGKRGYNEGEVDAFLEVIEAALRDLAASTLTSRQVREVAFGKPRIGRRGYDEDEVDAFLYVVEEHLKSQ